MDYSNMEQDLRNFMMAGFSQSDAYPKALANYMFREIIEDAHTKYNISQEDMKAMCKQAVNRAALYISLYRSGRPTAMQAFSVYAAACAGWDDAEETEDIRKTQDLVAACEEILLKQTEK